MSARLRYYRGRAVGRAFLHPVGWLTWAFLFLTGFLLLHLAGWRDDTAIISGTFGAAGSSTWTCVRGVLYGLGYFAAVVASPILVLAALVYGLMQAVFPARETREAESPKGGGAGAR